MCKVVNKYKEPYDVYIGRGSMWGNPFRMEDKSALERLRVIEEYRKYLVQQIKNGGVTIEQLKQLNGKTLGCYCKPKDCHGDVIVRAVSWAMKQTS